MVAENFQNNVLHTVVIAFVLVQVFQGEAKMRLDPKRLARKRPEREMVRKLEEVERASGLEEERGRGVEESVHAQTDPNPPAKPKWAFPQPQREILIGTGQR